MTIVISWFRLNSLSANPEKFQMFFGFKLLGINIDHKLSFLPHVDDICQKASQKTKGLLRIRNYFTCLFQRHGCCMMLISCRPLPTVHLYGCFVGNLGDGLVNKTHHRALHAVYQEFGLNLPKLFNKDDSGLPST